MHWLQRILGGRQWFCSGLVLPAAAGWVHPLCPAQAPAHLSACPSGEAPQSLVAKQTEGPEVSPSPANTSRLHLCFLQRAIHRVYTFLQYGSIYNKLDLCLILIYTPLYYLANLFRCNGFYLDKSIDPPDLGFLYISTPIRVFICLWAGKV